MMRTVALALGVTSLVAALAAPGASAGEPDKDQTQVEKRVLIRHGGGGFLGVGLADVEGDARGAVVRSVEPDGPAGKAGIKEGDVIVRFDGETVRSAAQLVRLVGETPAGRSVALEALRAGATEKLAVTLGEGDRMRMRQEALPGERGLHLRLPLPPQPPEVSVEGGRLHVTPHVPPRLGIEFIEIGKQLAAAYHLDDDEGVLIASVLPGSAAERAGLKAGDVILELDGNEIEDAGDLHRVVGDADPGETVKIKVLRAGQSLVLDVTFAGGEQHPHGPTL